ncbi:hypothetical protein B296_00011097 [Ensete ventricosum]|uniref:DYW domain-containing protein n=1 Tax=Ensete ventricosum TaxID=4639 RepID=A0A427B1Q8_ENSVE|nr:hypothetical protein B296_00011097 [Ensete ventricosum]
MLLQRLGMLLQQCSQKKAFRHGIALHASVIKTGMDSDLILSNHLINLYAKCKDFESSHQIFDHMSNRNIVSWSAMISGYDQAGKPSMALDLFAQMPLQPNEYIYGSLISACATLFALTQGLELFRLMIKQGLDPDDPDEFTTASALAVSAELASFHYGGQIHAHLIRTRMVLDIVVYNAIINMYAKCGCSKYASHVFNLMPNRNLISYNTMIAAHGNHGHATAALEIFKRMRYEGFVADSVTFVGLLTACSHAGLAECYVKTSSFQNDCVIWGNLLSSCRLHKNVVVGERAAIKLLELQPGTSSPYVLLSNLYASDGRWEDVAEARKMLKCTGVKKEPGHSFIEVKGITEKFTVGDFSHAQIEEIMVTLESLNWMTKKLYMSAPFD